MSYRIFIMVESDEAPASAAGDQSIAEALRQIENLREFAGSSGIPRRTLYNVMTGDHASTKRTIARIRKALDKLQPRTKAAK